MREENFKKKMATPIKVPRLSVGRPKKSESAKKRRKAETQKEINRSRIFIGDQIDRWNAFKKRNGVKTNGEAAKLLLDRSDRPTEVVPGGQVPSSSKVSARRQVMIPKSTSTPAPAHRLEMLKAKEADSSTEKSSISGVAPLQSLSHGTFTTSSDSPRQQSPSKERKIPPGFSGSFLDPFELSIDLYEDSDRDAEDDEDEDYEPSCDIFIGPINEDICEASFAEEFFPTEEEEEVSEDAPIEGVKRFETAEEAASLANDKFYICSADSLLTLAEMRVPGCCKTCSKTVSVQRSTVGSAVYFKWICEDGHISQTWCSQPLVRRGVHSGDLMIAAAVLFSGNNFQKISMLACYLNLPLISESSYNRFQTAYLVPVVESFWLDHVSQILKDKGGKEVVILGDGRMDSPGHCAQYCTYTAMDNSTKEIISVITVDKRETGKSSIRMEKEAFLRTLEYLESEGLKVVEVVTDAHVSIAAYLRKECPQIQHSFDVWHVAKNLAKKIMKAGQKTDCTELKGWCRHIVNHFYHTCDKAGDVEEFTGIWFGLLHHVVNEHEWSFTCGSDITSCQHGPLTEPREVKWLSKGSPAHDALRGIVADRKFLQQIPYFLNARSTAELEGFNNLILMYAGKRFSYIPPVYRARNLLAAIDHNSHLNRPSLLNKDGFERVHKIFNKKSARWLIRPVKEKKKYEYRRTLMETVLKRRMDEKKSIFGPVELQPNDPRKISSTIAQIHPPPTEQLRKEQSSRFKGKQSSLQQ